MMTDKTRSTPEVPVQPVAAMKKQDLGARGEPLVNSETQNSPPASTEDCFGDSSLEEFVKFVESVTGKKCLFVGSVKSLIR